MAVLKMIYAGDPILRQKARRVRSFDAELHTLLDNMLDTLLEQEGVGLAAPQIGVSQRVIIVRLPDDEESKEEYGEQAGVLYEMINPEIIKSANETVEGVEACLSIPGYFGSVDRSTMVVVRGQDRHGEEMRVKAYDWLARVFQHEIDHLEGILYTDRAKDVWQSRERRARRELIEETASDDPSPDAPEALG